MTERCDSRVTDDERKDAKVDGDEADVQADPEPDDRTDHLDDIEDGAGCTEIWERLSERREG